MTVEQFALSAFILGSLFLVMACESPAIIQMLRVIFRTIWPTRPGVSRTIPPQIPQEIEVQFPGPSGEESDFTYVRFENGKALGDFAEAMTRAYFAAQNYEHIDAQYDGFKGVDGLFFRRSSDGSVEKILIVETKANGATLNTNQMTDAWLIDVLKKAEAQKSQSGDLARAKEIRRAVFWLERRKNIERLLVTHKFDSGNTVVQVLDRKAGVLRTKEVNTTFMYQYLNDIRDLSDSVKITRVSRVRKSNLQNQPEIPLAA